MLAIDRAMSDSDNRSHMDTFEVNHDHSGPESYQFEPLRTVVVCDETSIQNIIGLHLSQWQNSSHRGEIPLNRGQPAHSQSSKIVKTHNSKTGIERQPQPQTAMPISYHCHKG